MGLLKTSALFHAGLGVCYFFSNKGLGAFIQSNLRCFIKRLAFFPVLPVLLLGRSVAMTKMNQHFKTPDTRM